MGVRSRDGGKRPYILVMGGGKVGYALTRHLLERDYEVALIEKSRDRAEWLASQLGMSSVLVGDGDEMAFLATTGIERAAVVIAATGDDDDNLVACQLARHTFKVPRTIARVNTPSNVKLFRALGIDAPISATELLMGLIEAELCGDELVRGVAVKASGANLLDVALPDLSTLIGQRLEQLGLPDGDMVVCIVRGARPVIPRPDEVIQKGDELIIYSTTLDVDRIRTLVEQ